MRPAIAKHTFSIASTALLAALLALAALPVAGARAETGGATAATPSTTPAPGGGETSGGSATGTQTPAVSKPTLATWFGPGFYGHETACGQTMSAKLVGVASRTLACGTLVRIGYRGHELTVPVLDRGPYGDSGAMWDLTTAAAKALKIKQTVRITTQIVGSVPDSPLLGAPGEESAPAAGAASESSTTVAPTGGASAG